MFLANSEGSAPALNLPELQKAPRSEAKTRAEDPLETVGFYGGKFSPFHQGHLSAILKAASQVDRLYVAVISDEEWEKRELYSQGRSRVPFFSLKERARFIKETFRNFPNIEVAYAEQPETGCPDEDWAAGAREIWKLIGRPISKIFSSEPSYEVFFRRFYPEAEHVLLDPDRREVPISATMIREEGAFKHWDKLPEAVRKALVKKVAILGTESSGKSYLTRSLALIYNTSHVEEYGRTYMEEVGDIETLQSDYPLIAMKHFLEVEEATKKANKLLFVDTEALVTQNFSLLYEGFRQGFIDEVANLQSYDLYIFLEPDLPWVNDGTRVFGEEEVRKQATASLKALLDEKGITYFSVKGSYLERLSAAQDLIKRELLSKF